MGCDGCCKRLAEILRLTRTEWDLLQTGLSNLSSEILNEITQMVAELSTQLSQLLACPMLDKLQGIYKVYDYRPIVCRTYGYYVRHDKGFYCTNILEQVSSGKLDEVVWKNQNIIDRQFSSFGDAKNLTEWFSHWK